MSSPNMQRNKVFMVLFVPPTIQVVVKHLRVIDDHVMCWLIKPKYYRVLLATFVYYLVFVLRMGWVVMEKL